ncbi:MAG TPA: polysaccharide deacetylase family protein [Alphaproteobacteria bacterium]|jgi:hypothetical protein
MSEAQAWARLDAELAAWQATGRTPVFWWRDDDAGDATPALLRLLALARTHGAPLALATVPAWATPDLAAAVADSGGRVAVLQHGYAHENHAPLGAKKSELGPERPAPIVVAEIAEGWQRLEARFGGHFWPVLVPPWNRMAPYLPPFLAELRYRGLSQFGPRARPEPVKGLAQVNTHVDIVYWKGPAPRFAGAEKSLGEFARHLGLRRSGEMDAAEPIGLLTHHAAHDEACWAFLEALLGHLAPHKAVRWLPAARVFADGAPP